MALSRFGRVVQADGIVLAMLLCSLGVNVYLAVTQTRSRFTAQDRAQLVALGSNAPTFEGYTLTGSKIFLDYSRDRRPTLLYVFSPTCHWCEKNLANITAIVKARPDLHVIGVNIGSPVNARAADTLPFAEIVRPTTATAQAYHLNSTPATLLVNADGKIVKAWLGAYGGPVAVDVSKALAVTLPGFLDEYPRD